jgi:hypothetical protein
MNNAGYFNENSKFANAKIISLNRALILMVRA